MSTHAQIVVLVFLRFVLYLAMMDNTRNDVRIFQIRVLCPLCSGYSDSSHLDGGELGAILFVECTVAAITVGEILRETA